MARGDGIKSEKSEKLKNDISSLKSCRDCVTLFQSKRAGTNISDATVGIVGMLPFRSEIFSIVQKQNGAQIKFGTKWMDISRFEY